MLLLELVEFQGAVVERGREPETVIHQCLFSRTVAIEHPVELRDRLVALVDNDQKSSGK